MSWQYMKKYGTNVAYGYQSPERAYQTIASIIDKDQNIYTLSIMAGDTLLYDKRVYQKKVTGGSSFLALMKLRCDGSIVWSKTISGDRYGIAYPDWTNQSAKLFFGRNENEIIVATDETGPKYYIDTDTILPISNIFYNTCMMMVDSMGSLKKVMSKNNNQGFCMVDGYFPRTQNYYMLATFDSSLNPRVGIDPKNISYKGKTLNGNYFILLDTNFNYVKVTEISKIPNIEIDTVSPLPLYLGRTYAYLGILEKKSLGVYGNKAYFMLSGNLPHPLNTDADQYKRYVFKAHNDSLRCLPSSIFTYSGLNFSALMVYDDSANHVLTKFGYPTTTLPDVFQGTCGFSFMWGVNLGTDGMIYFARQTLKDDYQWNGDTIKYPTNITPSDAKAVTYGAIDTLGKLRWYNFLPASNYTNEYATTLTPQNEMVYYNDLGVSFGTDFQTGIRRVNGYTGYYINGVEYHNKNYSSLPDNKINHKPILIKLKQSGPELITVGDDRRRDIYVWSIKSNGLGHIYMIGNKIVSGSVLNEDSSDFEIPGRGNWMGEMFIAKYGNSNCTCDSMYGKIEVVDSSQYGKITVKYTSNATDSVVYDWGDGNILVSKPANSQKTKSYIRDTIYTIRSTVYNNCNQKFQTERKVKIKCDTVIPQFSITKVQGKTIEVSYSGTNTDTIEYIWGDGTQTRISTPITQNVNHTYAVSVDTITISVKVKNKCGKQDSIRKGYRFCKTETNYTQEETCDSIYILKQKIDTNYVFKQWSDGVLGLNRKVIGTLRVTGLYLSKAGCEYRDSFEIVKLGLSKSTQKKYYRGCTVSQITLNGKGIGVNSYNWSTGEQTAAITVSKSGVYILEKEYKCGKVRDTFILEDSISNRTDTLKVISCQPYLWRDSLYRVTGKYSRKIQNTTIGCDSILVLDLTIGLEPKVRVSNGTQFAVLENYDSYQWYICNPWRKISNEQKQNFWTITKGSFAVVVTRGSCIDTSECVSNKNSQLETNIKGKEMILYPNPFRESIEIIWRNENNSPTDINVYDYTGRKIYTVEGIQKDRYRIEDKEWSKGVYWIEVKNEWFEQREKVIKE
jgi:hypothetical protein